MKKFTLFALLAVLIQFMSVNIFSQWIGWEKRKLYSYETRGFSIINSADGNLLIAGTLHTGGYIYKSNQNGDSLWACLNAWGNSLTEDGVGNIYSIKENNYYKINSSGQLIWIKSLYDSLYTNVSSRKIIRTSDNNLMIVGQGYKMGYSCGYFAKYDLNGNKIWSNSINSNTENYYINSISEETNGTFTAIGSKWYPNISKNFFLRINGNGQIISSKDFGQNDNQLKIAHNVFKLNNNAYHCFTSYRQGNTKLIITELDSLGNMIWERMHGDDFRPYYITSGEGIIKDRFTNQYVVAASEPVGSPPYDTNFCSLSAFDSLGNLAWERITYSDSFPSYVNGLTQNSDSTYVICGDAFIDFDSDVPASPDYLYLLKTKKINPIGIVSISTENPSKFTLRQNYPNPFNPNTKILFELPKSSDIEFNVYDVLGRKVYSGYYNKSAGTYEIDFDASGFASGIYFYSVKAGEYYDTKKMIILK